MMVLRKSYLSFAETTQDMVKTAAPKSSPIRRVKWLRYVLLGVVGFGIYHILSGPSGAFNLMKLRKTNARYVDELDSLTVSASRSWKSKSSAWKRIAPTSNASPARNWAWPSLAKRCSVSFRLMATRH